MQLKIDTLCYGADAVARTAEGKTVFVSGGVPGDVVEAEITSDGKTFSKARVTSVVEASVDRVASKCPYSAICGGCPWAEVSIDAQRQAKRKDGSQGEALLGSMPKQTGRGTRPMPGPPPFMPCHRVCGRACRLPSRVPAARQPVAKG